MRHFSITNLVNDHSFTKFLESNKYYVKCEETSIYLDKWCFPKSHKIYLVHYGIYIRVLYTI